MMLQQLRISIGIVCLLTLPGLAGCGQEEDGPSRFALEGAVRYDGAPVPYGEILFTPDNSRGNHGPGAVGTIKEGRYRIPAEKGAVSGPHRVRIQGADGPPLASAVPAPGEKLPQQLFPEYTSDVDLSPDSPTQDFDIPKKSKSR